jgi:hypothetical protein
MISYFALCQQAIAISKSNLENLHANFETCMQIETHIWHETIISNEMPFYGEKYSYLIIKNTA